MHSDLHLDCAVCVLTAGSVAGVVEPPASTTRDLNIIIGDHVVLRDTK